MLPNNFTELFEYFRITNEKRIADIEEALSFFETLPCSFVAVCSFETNRFIFISPMVEKLLGYPIEMYATHGYKFLFQIIPDFVLPKLMAWQSELIKTMTSLDFDYTVPLLIDFEGALYHTDKTIIPLYQTGLVLEYEPGGDTRTFISIWIQTNTNGKLTIRKALLHNKLKEFHHLLLGPLSKEKKHDKGSLVRIKAPHFQEPKLTKKEKELLLLLAQGIVLKVIAKKMNVSYYTSESHRKNLFEKFEVHNVAELIQKASKVYWLE